MNTKLITWLTVVNVGSSVVTATSIFCGVLARHDCGYPRFRDRIARIAEMSKAAEWEVLAAGWENSELKKTMLGGSYMDISRGKAEKRKDLPKYLKGGWDSILAAVGDIEIDGEKSMDELKAETAKAEEASKKAYKEMETRRKKKQLDEDREWLAKYDARNEKAKKKWEEEKPGVPWVDYGAYADKARQIRKRIEAAEKQFADNQ